MTLYRYGGNLLRGPNGGLAGDANCCCGACRCPSHCVYDCHFPISKDAVCDTGSPDYEVGGPTQIKNFRTDATVSWPPFSVDGILVNPATASVEQTGESLHYGGCINVCDRDGEESDVLCPVSAGRFDVPVRWRFWQADGTEIPQEVVDIPFPPFNMRITYEPSPYPVSDPLYTDPYVWLIAEYFGAYRYWFLQARANGGTATYDGDCSGASTSGTNPVFATSAFTTSFDVERNAEYMENAPNCPCHEPPTAGLCPGVDP